jgi:uncharacterized protein YcbK (DUF882 family)
MGSAENLETELLPNHAPHSPRATQRVGEALKAAERETGAFGRHVTTDSGIVDYNDSTQRRAWLTVDRAINLAHNASMKAPRRDSAPLEAQQRRLDSWATGSLVLRVLHSGETVDAQLYDSSGQMQSSAVDKLSQAMVDWRSSEVRSIDVRLLAILYRVSRAFEQPLTLVSGYRVRGLNASMGSRHGAGRAADILIRGVSSRQIAQFVERNFCKVGVGIYPTSGFVHIDVRDRSYYWLDRSGPNEPSREIDRAPEETASCRDDLTSRTTAIPERLYFPAAR